MLITFAYNLISLNLSFFAELLLGNFFWLFSFLAVGLITSDGKKVIKNSLIVLLIVYFMRDFFALINFMPFSGENAVLFIAFFYLVLPIFIEKTRFQANYRKLLVSGVVLYSSIGVLIGFI